MIVNINEALSVNTNQIDIVLYPVYNMRKSKSNKAYDTFQTKVELSKKDKKFYDFTNSRDGIKSLIVLSDGLTIATSLTREAITLKLANNKKPKSANK